MEKLQSMVDFIFEIDNMSTKDFCDKYGCPHPHPTKDIDEGVNMFLQVDAIKHRLFLDHAKKLHREWLAYSKDAKAEKNLHQSEDLHKEEEANWCLRILIKAGQMSIAHNQGFCERQIMYAIQNQVKNIITQADKDIKDLQSTIKIQDLKLENYREMVTEYQRVFTILLSAVDKAGLLPEVKPEYERLLAAKEKHLTFIEEN